MFKRKKHNWTIPEGQEPTAFDKKILSYQNQGFLVPTRKLIKTPEQIEGIKQSGVINTGVLDLIEQEIHAGMTTEEIDKLVYDYTVSHGAIPAPLNYEGFPKSVCTSINEVVCHGIPNDCGNVTSRSKRHSGEKRQLSGRVRSLSRSAAISTSDTSGHVLRSSAASITR